MENETSEQKAERVKKLLEIVQLTKEGYAGVLPNGNIVDRRIHPEAIPVQKNLLFDSPDPKPVKSQEEHQ